VDAFRDRVIKSKDIKLIQHFKDSKEVFNFLIIAFTN